jgi:L-ascorbate metabolism protein UlaG (beta-lactamase superfamily)
MMEITYHGHSFVEVTGNDGTTVLIDPFMNENPWNDSEPADFDPDLVAVTHAHFDHVEESTTLGTTVLGQAEVASYLETEHGHEDVIGINIGGTYSHGGLSLTMVQAFHSAGTIGEGDFEGYGGTAAGYIIDDGQTRFYHAGDTGLFGDMKTVISDVYDPDVAAVPIGDHFTMGIDDAAIAVDWLDVDVAIPIHYDTIPQIETDPNLFVEAVENAEVHVLDTGEIRSY